MFKYNPGTFKNWVEASMKIYDELLVINNGFIEINDAYKTYRALMYEQSIGYEQSVSNTFTLSYNNGNWQRITLTGDTTFSFSDFLPLRCATVILVVTQGSPGNHLLDFTNSGLVVQEGQDLTSLDVNTGSGDQTYFHFQWDGYKMRVWSSKDGITL